MWRGNIGSKPRFQNGFSSAAYESKDPRRTSSGGQYFREGRDDQETTRRVESSEGKVGKFDALLKKIEAERKRMSTDNTPSRLETGERSESPMSPKYDYTRRVRDSTPRRSCPGVDSMPKRFKSPFRAQRLSEDICSSEARPHDSKGNHYQRNLISPKETIETFEKSVQGLKTRLDEKNEIDSPASRSEVDERCDRESPESPNYDYSHRLTDSTPRRSVPGVDAITKRFTSPFRSQRTSADISPADARHHEVQEQIEQYQRNIASAHETIETQERNMKSLKSKIDEKDETIASLERNNKSLNESLAERRNEIVKINEEKNRLVAEKDDLIVKHTEEINQLSSECEETAKVADKANKSFENSLEEKDKMIANLRAEISRLNLELADGSAVRDQASKAEEHANKLELELEESRFEHTRAMDLIQDLEKSLEKERLDAEKKIKAQSLDIKQLESKVDDAVSFKQRAERAEEKVIKLESQLDRSRSENMNLTDKAKECEKRLEHTVRLMQKKEEIIDRLENESLEAETREKDLRKQVDKLQRELDNQRARIEVFHRDCVMEQETVTALEHAIEALEVAHNESNDEIVRLQNENQSLSKTLEEAEKYMLMYKDDLQDANELKSRLEELQIVHHELEASFCDKDEHIATLMEKEEHLEASLDELKGRVVELKSQLTEKKEIISKQKAEIDLIKESAQESKHELMMVRNDLSSKESKIADSEEKLISLKNLLKEKEVKLKEAEASKIEMRGAFSKLEKELDQVKSERKNRLGAILDRDLQLEISQKEAKKAWDRVHELEETVRRQEAKVLVETKVEPEVEQLTIEMDFMKKKLAKRDEQLEESKKGISEAQKMIYKLMETVQELRKRVKKKESGDKDTIE